MIYEIYLQNMYIYIYIYIWTLNKLGPGPIEVGTGAIGPGPAHPECVAGVGYTAAKSPLLGVGCRVPLAAGQWAAAASSTWPAAAAAASPTCRQTGLGSNLHLKRQLHRSSHLSAQSFHSPAPTHFSQTSPFIEETSILLISSP